MEEITHETVVLHDPKSKYEKEWIVEYIVDERNKNKTWQEIVDGLKERGEESISTGVVSKLYKKALARTITTVTEAKEEFIDFTEQLREVYGDVISLMGAYVRALRGINEELDKIRQEDEEGKIDVLATQLAIAKQIPQATGLMKEVREYVKNQIALYDVIQETKEKDVVWSEEKMIEYVKEFLPTYLKELEAQGKIEIKDKTILK